MKKIYTDSFIFSLLVFFSCSTDFLKSYDKRIIGTWELRDINTTGFGGNADNLPFREGQFIFNADGTMTYTNASGTIYQGQWDIVKKNIDGENVYRSLLVSVTDFSAQHTLTEYYDDMNFRSTDHFVAKVVSGWYTYITHFRR